MIYGFCIIRMLKFYATTVSPIKLIFYIDKGTLMLTWKFCNIFVFRLTEAATRGVL